jgi:AcrR family transcriptional regulator
MMIDRNSNKKIQQLLLTAQNLFMRHGIRRVTVEEICSEANISKMTFYKYFKNKIELIKYLLKQIFAEQMAAYRQIMEQKIPYTDKVKNMIQLKDDYTKMISQEFINDLYKNPIPEIAEMIENLREESITEVLNDLKDAREKGDIRQNLKPELILYFINHMKDIVKEGKLSNIYPTPNELIMELTNFFFYGILPVGKDAKN